MSPVLNFTKIPVCKVIDGLKTVPFFQAVLNELRIFASEFLEICSRSGEIKAMNVSFEKSDIVKMYPSGSYQAFYHGYDSIDSNIGCYKFFTTVTNS
jgi:hypothetical protein